MFLPDGGLWGGVLCRECGAARRMRGRDLGSQVHWLQYSACLTVDADLIVILGPLFLFKSLPLPSSDFQSIKFACCLFLLLV